MVNHQFKLNRLANELFAKPCHDFLADSNKPSLEILRVPGAIQGYSQPPPPWDIGAAWFGSTSQGTCERLILTCRMVRRRGVATWCPRDLDHQKLLSDSDFVSSAIARLSQVPCCASCFLQFKLGKSYWVDIFVHLLRDSSTFKPGCGVWARVSHHFHPFLVSWFGNLLINRWWWVMGKLSNHPKMASSSAGIDSWTPSMDRCTIVTWCNFRRGTSPAASRSFP